MTDVENKFWNGHRMNSFWYGVFYDDNKMRLLWYWLVVLAVSSCTFFVGMWVSSRIEKPINVPYVTGAGVSSGDDASLITEDGCLTILVVGFDKRKGDVGRSDTLMVAFVDPEAKTMRLLSVPRDTYVELSGHDNTKINHAFAYGGVELTRTTVENLLGITIDRYVAIDFNGFSALVDSMGGIDYEVEQNMYNSAEKINLKAGMQHLDGAKALQYVRWRDRTSADIGRIGRQQAFVMAVAKEMLDMGNIFKMPKMVNTILENVETDFSKKEMLSMINVFEGAVSQNVETEMLPGDSETINGISYWLVDETLLADTVNRMINGEPEIPEDEAGAGANTVTE
ncbi:MAG: LCP family protein [Clostridia bacterium]|nr:LCP family protein [Clostridia bacterium]MDD4571766.1 LCP family protein [Clostridia bacterium]